jgi:hypothetical protein
LKQKANGTPRRISFGAAGPPSPKYSNPSWLEQLRVFHKLAIRYRLGFVEAGPPSLKLPSSLWQASPRQAGTAGCTWRIEYEGALYHVFSRGNNQQDIFSPMMIDMCF